MPHTKGVRLGSGDWGGVTEEHGCVILMKPVCNLLLTYLLTMLKCRY